MLLTPPAHFLPSVILIGLEAGVISHSLVNYYVTDRWRCE